MDEKILSSVIISCPVCGKKTFSIIQRLDNIPYFGEVLETFGHCDSCGYKASDILVLEEKEETNQTVVISKEKDLFLRFIKSKFAEIEVPEIGLKITPGPSSEAYISNVEGFINRIIDVLRKMKTLIPDKEREVEEKIEFLEKVKKNEEEMTIILKDKTGQSAIIEEKKKEFS